MPDYEDRPLIGYLPEVLQEVREYQALTFGEQPEIFELFAGAGLALDNQFIMSSTRYGVERWERLLGIVYTDPRTLDERKFAILARLAEQLPYTYRRLVSVLEELCGAGGYAITLNAGAYRLTVVIELVSKNKFVDAETMLRRIVPANLITAVSLHWNEHRTLAPFTHGHLAAYTHRELREEVIT
jgi:hypothetical protein